VSRAGSRSPAESANSSERMDLRPRPIDSTSYLDQGSAHTCDLDMSMSRLELSSMLCIPKADHSIPTALAERRHALIDLLKQDHRDLKFAYFAWRVSTAKYCETGVLEPLRANLEAFIAINP